MSAAVENFKKGWLLAVFSLASTVIGGVIMQGMQSNNAKFKEQDCRIDSKADVTYVDKRFVEFEKLQNAYFKGIEDMFALTNSQLKEIKEDLRSMKK